MDPTVYYVLSAVLASLGVSLILRRRRRTKIKRRYWVRPWLRRRNLPMHHNMLHLYKELLIDGDVQEFRSTLRMEPEVYASLLDILRPGLQKQHSNFRKPISPDARLALTMRFLALGEGFRSLSQQFRIGLSTTRVIVRETCKAIARLMQNKYIVTPRSQEEWLQIASDFNQRWNMPHCIGCIDGKHIRIMAPRKSGSFFFNYKDYFSIVLLAIVDSDYQFIYIDIGAEGKASDGGIWTKCSFFQHLIAEGNPLDIPQPTPLPEIPNNVPFFLVGDDAFRLGPNLMKPYAGGGLTQKQQIYNYRICRCRRIVENAFGILSCRFKVFRRTIEVNPDFVEDIVLAACILHNFLRQTASSDYIPSVAVDHEVLEGNLIPGAWRKEVALQSMQRDTGKNASVYAKKIRDSLSDYFVTKDGEIPWQYRKAVL